MSTTHSLQVGNKGRVVIPALIREHKGWREGVTLIAVESDAGVLLVSRDEAESALRRQLAGKDLVSELLAERREFAAREDVG